jgi:protein-S-isoprenylcysteine O-methyltransferase Ste14
MRLFSGVRGRVAKPAGAGWNMAKTLTQSLVMWVIFLFLLPALVYRVEEWLGLAEYRFSAPLWRGAGAVVFALGWALGWTCAYYMVVCGKGTPLPADATRQLVVAGPYRYVRNPMAMGSFAQGIAVGLFVGSPLVVLYALAGAVGWNYFVRPWEEIDLEHRFGAAFRHYRDRVRCWIPRLRPYEPGET